MATNTMTYQGVEITITDAAGVPGGGGRRFSCTLGGERVTEDSLEAVKARIDASLKGRARDRGMMSNPDF